MLDSANPEPLDTSGLDRQSLSVAVFLETLDRHQIDPADSAGSQVLVRGVFDEPAAQVKNYNGFFYLPLLDTRTSRTIKVKLSESFLNEIAWGHEITLAGVLSFSDYAGRIEPLLSLDRIEHAGRVVRSTREELIERWGHAIVRPRRDAQSVFRTKRPRITVVTGVNSVALADIKSQLGGLDSHCEMVVRAVRIHVAEQVAIAIRGSFDSQLVVIARGGGPDVATLDNDLVIEAISGAPVPVAVAAGHATDQLVIDRIADTSFPTPTAFGQWLRHGFESRASESRVSQNTAKASNHRTKNLAGGPASESHAIELKRSTAAAEKTITRTLMDQAAQRRLLDLETRNADFDGQRVRFEEDKKSFASALRQSCAEKDRLREEMRLLTDEKSRLAELAVQSGAAVEHFKRAYLSKKKLSESVAAERERKSEAIGRLQVAVGVCSVVAFISIVVAVGFALHGTRPSNPVENPPLQIHTVLEPPVADPPIPEPVPAKAVASPTALPDATPLCPVCGKRMVQRQGKFGKFWGCPDFPNCRGTRQSP